MSLPLPLLLGANSQPALALDTLGVQGPRVAREEQGVAPPAEPASPAQAALGLVLRLLLWPRAVAVGWRCGCHMAAAGWRCGCHAVAMRWPRGCHAVAMGWRRHDDVVATRWQ